jgi:groucho
VCFFVRSFSPNFFYFTFIILEDTYIRSCKVLPGDRKILVGGECDSLFLWDVGNGAPRILGELKSETAACYAMAIAPATARQRSPICFACCSNGNINVWDVHNQVLIRLQMGGFFLLLSRMLSLNGIFSKFFFYRSFKGHDEGASCVDVFSDGSKLATGGLDRCVRVWDLAEDSEILQYPFEHKVFALGVSPTSNFLAVGFIYV